MKLITLCLIFLPLTLFGAQVVPLPSLPRGELPNSEVVTNIALNVYYAQWNRLRIVKRGIGDVEVDASYSREYTKFFIRVR